MAKLVKTMVVMASLLAGAGCCHTCDVCDDCGDSVPPPEVYKKNAGCATCGSKAVVQPINAVIVPQPVVK
jgi:recombinational DNA repair protein (RecF pathway)